MKKPMPYHRVEVGLREINQLFNSLDPTPFNEKDLDQNAEDFIVSWVQEYPINGDCKPFCVTRKFVSSKPLVSDRQKRASADQA